MTEEEIFRYYLGIDVRKGLFRNPLRVDNNPTASFFRGGNNILYFHDFKTGTKYSCFDVVKEVHNISFRKSLYRIAQDFDIIKKQRVKSTQKITSTVKVQGEYSKIDVEIQSWTNTDTKYWGKYYITSKVLKDFNVVSCKRVWLNDQIIYKYHYTNPAYGYYFGKDRWKIYFPLSNKQRFLSNTNCIQGLHNLPKEGDILILQKSYKDVMCMSLFGIPAIAKQGEAQILSNREFEAYSKRFKTIYSFYDYDGAGIVSMNKMKKLYNIRPLYFNKSFDTKDFSDYVEKYGPIKTKQLCQEFLNSLETPLNIKII